MPGLDPVVEECVKYLFSILDVRGGITRDLGWCKITVPMSETQQRSECQGHRSEKAEGELVLFIPYLRGDSAELGPVGRRPMGGPG